MRGLSSFKDISESFDTARTRFVVSEFVPSIFRFLESVMTFRLKFFLLQLPISIFLISALNAKVPTFVLPSASLKSDMKKFFSPFPSPSHDPMYKEKLLL